MTEINGILLIKLRLLLTDCEISGLKAMAGDNGMIYIYRRDDQTELVDSFPFTMNCIDDYLNNLKTK